MRRWWVAAVLSLGVTGPVAWAKSFEPLAVVPVEDDVLGIPAARYPRLAQRFSTAEASAPPGWRLEYRADGDIDRDGRDDLVLVMRQDDPESRVVHEGLGPSPFDTNPRMLVVGLGEHGGYRLAVQNFTFIPRNVTPTMDDPLVDAPTIQNGVLSIRLTLFLSAGGWTTWSTESKFRFQGDALRLIGQEYVQVRRNTGEMVVRSANLLTGRIETVATHIDAERDDQPTVVTRSVYRNPPTLDEVGNGLDFDPTGQPD